jgi:hypothetical protein
MPATDDVLVVIRVGQEIQPPRHITRQHFERLLERGPRFGISLTVLYEEDPEPRAQLEAKPKELPPVPLDRVVAGCASDLRWRSVDPKRWVVNSAHREEA